MPFAFNHVEPIQKGMVFLELCHVRICKLYMSYKDAIAAINVGCYSVKFYEFYGTIK